MTPPKKYKQSESPAVLLSLPSLRRSRQELKVRVVQYSKSEPQLDIREYLSQNGEFRFTKKGITLDAEHVIQLKAAIDTYLSLFSYSVPKS